MADVRDLPATDVRVETGAVRFGDDWPGVFIRGDNAMFLASHLESDDEAWRKMGAQRLIMLLKGCHVDG